MPSSIRLFARAQRSLGLLVLLTVVGTHSLALAQAVDGNVFATQAVKKTKRPKPDKGNGETTQEREKRLLRECKGRPNAGACEGYAN